jgi:hypothetical protein
MQDDTAGAQRFLKLNLREHVAWERNTVWRQMIGRERRGQGGTPLGAPVDTTEEKAFEVKTRRTCSPQQTPRLGRPLRVYVHY